MHACLVLHAICYAVALQQVLVLCAAAGYQLDADTVIKSHTSRSALHAEPHYCLNIHLVRSIVPSLGHL